jgi:hypothetical protein
MSEGNTRAHACGVQLWNVAIPLAADVANRFTDIQERARFWQSFVHSMAGSICADLGATEAMTVLQSLTSDESLSALASLAGQHTH